MVLLVHHRQLLDFVLLQNLGSGNQVGLLMSGHQILFRHHIIDHLVKVAFKTQVAVGHNTHEMILIIHNGDSTDMIFSHHIQCILYSRSSTDGNRVVNHSVLSSLDDGHMASLVFNGHILMDYTDTSLTGDGDCHLRFRYRIHGSGHERNVQLDVPREFRFQLYHFRQHLRISGNEQDVIVCQAVHHDFICNK